MRKTCRMIGLSRHNSRRIVKELTKYVSMVFIELWEDIVEEEKWSLSRTFMDVFPQETDKSEEKNLVFATGEDIFCWLPFIVYLDRKTHLIQMWSDSRSSYYEVSLRILTEELEEILCVDRRQRVTLLELDSYWSWEIQVLEGLCRKPAKKFPSFANNLHSVVCKEGIPRREISLHGFLVLNWLNHSIAGGEGSFIVSQYSSVCRTGKYEHVIEEISPLTRFARDDSEMIALYPKSSIGHFVFIFWLWARLFAHVPFWRNIVSIKNWLKEYLSELQSERPFWLSKRGFLCPARIMRIAGIDENRDGFTECWFSWAIITYHDLEILRNFYLFIWIMFELVEGEVHLLGIVLLLPEVPNYFEDSMQLRIDCNLKTNYPTSSHRTEKLSIQAIKNPPEFWGIFE